MYMLRFHWCVPYIAVNWFNIMIQSLKDIAYKMWRRQKQYHRLLLFTIFCFPSQKKYIFSSVNKTEQQYANISKL